MANNGDHSITDVIKDVAGINDIKQQFDVIDKAHSIENTSGATIDKAKYVNDRILGNTADVLGDTARRMKDRTTDNRSIISRTRNSIMQFPVYISQSIPVNPANVIARLFDRVYASFVQSALAMNPIISEEDVNNLSFLRGFHTNITEAVKAAVNEYYRPIDDVDGMMQESVFYRAQVTPNILMECAWVPASDEKLIAESRRCVYDSLYGFAYLSEANNVGDVTKTINDVALDRKELEAAAKDYVGLSSSVTDETTVNKAIDKFISDMKLVKRYQAYQDDYSNKGASAKNSRAEFFRDDSSAMQRIADIKAKGKLNAFDKYRLVGSQVRKNVVTTTNHASRDYVRSTGAPQLLKDTDVKRINSMIPWTIQASFHVNDSKGNPGYDMTFIIGVKAVLHPISASDLQSELRDLIMGNEKSLQKVRYKSGEINFMNYLFNVDSLKRDATTRMNHNKRWMNTLKRLSDMSRRSGGISFINNKKTAIPNGTLILTNQDVISLADATGIDLSNVAMARKLAKSLFLICVGILDATAGTFRVLFPDRDTDWDVQSIASIDAEVSKMDNSKIVSELNRLVNR